MQFDPPFLAAGWQQPPDTPPAATPHRHLWPVYLALPDRRLERSAGHSDEVWLGLEYAAACYWAAQDERAQAKTPARGQSRLSEDEKAERNRVYQQQHRDRKKAPNAKALELLHVLQGLEHEEAAAKAHLTVLKARILQARGEWQLACLGGADEGATVVPDTP